MSSNNSPSVPMHFMPFGSSSDRDSAGEQPEQIDYERFYKIYGECFSIWAQVELQLAAIFVCLLGLPNIHQAYSIFYSVPNFSGKLKMVKATVEKSEKVDERAQQKWKELNTVAQENSKKRNNLAHWVIGFGRHHEIGKKKMAIFHPYKLQPDRHFIDEDELKNIQESFISLKNDFYGFWRGSLPISTFPN